MRYLASIAILFVFFAITSMAQDSKESNSSEKWCLHFQSTIVMQGHPSFHSEYSGQNSLSDTAEPAMSITSTLYMGRELWKGASIYLNPEIAGGKGMSYTLGIAGFPNGQVFRVGDPAPTLYIGRFFFRQYIALPGSEYHPAEGELNQLAGESIPASCIKITVGKISLADGELPMFDHNSYTDDAMSQFLNWALMTNGAWDYPANTRGYTPSFVVEFIKPTWAIRAGIELMPKVANGSDMDLNISKARGENIEVEKDWKKNGRKGAVRLLAYRNFSHGRSYRDAIAASIDGSDTSLNVNSVGTYGGKKYGLGINAEQELTNDCGIFFRAGWNDGKTSSYVFTEIDQTITGGISIKGIKWKRPDDVFGMAAVVNGISQDHIDFLNAGGYGFIIGDGKLTHYGNEEIIETYYSARMSKEIWATLDYQFINNPAYNIDRGPVHVFGARVHVEF
jgi:high affinity Mn2+ porin